MTKTRFTHRGLVRNKKTNEDTAYVLRETKHCWVTKTGRRYLKSTGLPPGIMNKDLVLNVLLVDTVYQVFSNE